jgi:hypothetical protein
MVPVRVDHHVHLNSPAIQAFLPVFCDGMHRFGGGDPALTTPHSVDDLLAAMDQAGIRRALLLSDGYLAESPMSEPRRPDATDLMRAANDWTGGSPVAIRIGFPPLLPSIPFERLRCRRFGAGRATRQLPASNSI